jgi:hypothetical protein
LGAINLFGPVPVELFQGFEEGKVRPLEAALGGPVLALERFSFDQSA